MGRACLLALLLFCTKVQGQPRYEDDFRILTFNVFMLPKLISHWGQEARAHLIKNATFKQGHDLIILNELFDDSAAGILLNGLRAEYPYQTSVLAVPGGTWDATLGTPPILKVTNGGVGIVSRWPILEKIHWIYAKGCGTDYFSKKGFVYVKILKNGQPYHVIGTHMQSEADGCPDGGAAVRASQFDEMMRFIREKQIPADEILFIGGDLNVIKDTPEYEDMIRRLEVEEPRYAGHYSSWDPIGNGTAYGQYPNYDHSEYLDYIFYSKNHARPSVWHNQSLDVTSPRWAEGNYYYQEYSDHYPVQAFAQANASTPTHSFRPDNRPYDTVYLKHDATGRYITADASRPDGWLTVAASKPESAAAFALDNWYPAKHPFCIRSGDYIQLQSKLHPGYYWNWYLGFSGNYGYYLKNQDSSDKLRLFIIDDQGQCLQSGDRIYFVDRDTLKGRDAILQYWPDGSWKNYMFLWSNRVGANEIFTVEFPAVPVYADWSAHLQYD